MIIIACILAGAATGALMARKRGGTGLDIAQYAGSLAIAGAVAGLFVSILLARLL